MKPTFTNDYLEAMAMELSRSLEDDDGPDENITDKPANLYEKYWRLYDTRLMVVAVVAETEEDVRWALDQAVDDVGEEIVVLRPHEAPPGID